MFTLSNSIESSIKAFYRLEVSIIGRGKRPGSEISTTRSVVGCAAYRSGTRIKDTQLGLTFDYRNRTGIYHTEIIAPPEAPAWVNNRPILWNTVQAAEIRCDAQLAREFLLSLPKELALSDCRDAVREFVELCLVSKGMIADFAIHEPSRHAERGNIHAHIMTTTRSISKDGFGLKDRSWNTSLMLRNWRELWCELVNRYLEKAGLDLRVDHRSRVTIEFEEGRHFDYSIDHWLNDEAEAWFVERNDITVEPVFASDENENAVVVDGKSEQCLGVLESQDNITTQKLDAYLFPKVGDVDFECFGQAFQGLLDQISDSPSSKIDLKTDVERLIFSAEQRFASLRVIVDDLFDHDLKDQLALQMNIEESLFLAFSNEIQAKMLSAEDAARHATQISDCQRKAKKARSECKKYFTEWNRRAVRDDAYIPTNKEFHEKVNRFKSLEEEKWNKFNEKARINAWSSGRIEKEKRFLQEKLDFELDYSFGLYNARSMSR